MSKAVPSWLIRRRLWMQSHASPSTPPLFAPQILQIVSQCPLPKLQPSQYYTINSSSQAIRLFLKNGNNQLLRNSNSRVTLSNLDICSSLAPSDNWARSRGHVNFTQTTTSCTAQRRQYSRDSFEGDSHPKIRNGAESYGVQSQVDKWASIRCQRRKDGHSQRAPDVGQTNKVDVGSESIASSMSKYLNMPIIPHRPTKEELLAAANGFWERLKVRFKWMSIRSMRPWNADEWGAFVSWFMLGHLVWILVGTTTFFSLVIFSINTVFAQGMALNWVCC